MRIYTLILVIILSINVNGQGSTDRVRNVKMKFFNEKLELTQTEANKFWPVYHDYQSRRKLLLTERKKLMRFYMDNSANMSDEEVSNTLKRYIQIEKEELALLEKYNQRFREVLPDEKVLKIYITEIEFKNYLLTQLRTSKPPLKPRN